MMISASPFNIFFNFSWLWSPCSPVPPPNYLRKSLIIDPSLVLSPLLFFWCIMSHLGGLFSCNHLPAPSACTHTQRSSRNYCLLQWFSKCGSWSSSNNNPWKLRNADYSSSPQAHWIRNWRRAPSNLCFIMSCRWFWLMVRVENYWPMGSSVISSVCEGSWSSILAYQLNSVGFNKYLFCVGDL